MDVVWKGLIVGLAVAAPVGPIGLLVIRRSIADGRTVGLATGLGAAAADALYALCGALGIAAAVAGASWIEVPMRIVGAVLLAGFGIRALLAARRAEEAAPEEAKEGETRATLLRAFAGTFVLTITNPATILSFAAVAASLGVGRGSVTGALLLTVSVFVGSAAWWLLLSAAAAALRHRLGPRARRALHAASGVILIAFAIVALLP